MAYVNKGLVKRDTIKPNQSNLSQAKSISVSLPTSIDWRSQNIVNPIKNQGICGSCWSFSATGTLESYSALATGILSNLSDQNLVDCTYPG